MTTITVTFICDFKEIEISNKKKGKKDKKSKKKQKNEPEIQIVNEPKEVEPELTTIIQVKKPTHYLHIEYNLLPIKQIYKIDVVFWGNIAKVYTKDGMKATKSINFKKHCWIAFSIRHRIILENDDLIKLKTLDVPFSISTSKNKITSSVAKKEGDRTFYLNEIEVYELNQKIRSEFIEAFEDDPNIQDEKIKSAADVSYILDELICFPAKNELITTLQIIPDECQQYLILKLIENVKNDQNPFCLNTMEEPKEISELLQKKAKKAKKDKKKEKNKKKKAVKVESSDITILGEVFFTDPDMSLFDLKLTNDELFGAYTIINVENLINTENLDLNPLVIKVDKLHNIPVEVLNEKNFTHMYISYDFANEKYVSKAREIKKKINFFDHRVYFMSDENFDTLLQQIQTGYFIIQIYGIKLVARDKSDKMFGEDPEDFFISKPLHNSQEIYKYVYGENEASNNLVNLAVVPIKLSELLNPLMKFTKIEFCVHPNYLKHLAENYNEFDKITMNTVNCEQPKLFNANPLTEAIILENEMNLKVEVRVLKPFFDCLSNKIKEGTMFNRIILIIYDPIIVKSIMSKICLHNCKMLKKYNFIPNYLDKKANYTDVVDEKVVFTGFFICYGDHSIAFIEGQQKLVQEIIWKEIKNEKIQSIKVFFNSIYIFNRRIYWNLIVFGGIYVVTLQYSLQFLLQNLKTYTKGFMPDPCRRALQKIDLLLKSQYLYEIPENYLPSIQELLSLDFEWGVPVHWPCVSLKSCK